MDARFSFLPASADRLADVETVLDDCAASRNCRCAYWYLPNAAYKAGWGEANREWFRGLLREPRSPGIVAYLDRDPAGWCGVAPRAVFDRLRRSKTYAPIDERPVWAINCFVVRKAYRRRGVSKRLLRHAIDFARSGGADCVEAYPVEPARSAWAAGDLFRGTLSMFLDAGFVEVARPLPARPVLRLDLART